MKVERYEPFFKPIAIVLETEEELEELWSILSEKSKQDSIHASLFVEKLRVKLQDLRRKK